MGSGEFEIIREYILIPEKFHSFLTEGPFERCIICNRYLLGEGEHYLIEKGYKQTEVIFEYAMCFSCAEKMRGELSRESLQRIEAHFEERVDFSARRRRLLQVSTDDIEPWISRCILTKNKLQETDDYQIYAHCVGEHLVFSGCPYMVCGEALGGLYKLLSKKTRDAMDDFVDEYLGLPSEFKDLAPEEGPLVLI